MSSLIELSRRLSSFLIRALAVLKAFFSLLLWRILVEVLFLTLIAGNKIVKLLIKLKVSGEICANVRYYIKSTILDDATCRKNSITRKHFSVRQAM
jgi:hypothetical protein